MSSSDQIRWDARYREQGARCREPLPFLVALESKLPRHGCALDLAGGEGANAIWLARRGLDVTLADLSPVGLALARDAASAAGVRLKTLEIDLEREPFPPGPWDLVVCVRFLWRPLFEVIPAMLAPGGSLVFVHPTRSNLLHHERPGLHYLLEDGELPGLVQGLEITCYEEGWTDEGRHEARLVARRTELARADQRS